MSRLTELEAEYKQMIIREQAGHKWSEHAATAKEALQYIQNSTAQYHGRCVRTLYMPKLFTKAEVTIFENLVQTLFGIFEKVMKEYEENAAYRRQFGFDDRLERLILKPQYDCAIPMARIDIFLNEETGNFWFCEFNTDGSSAMNEDRELNHAVTLTKGYREFAARHKLAVFELFDSWVEEFLKIYHTGQYQKEIPNVAIVDFMENATEQEFRIFAEAFAGRGMTAEICEIRDLKYVKGKLYTPSGMEIDAVYRRAVTSDIMKHYDEVRDFIQAVEEDAVCLIGEFRTQIVHNKLLYKMLHEEQTHAFLTEEEIAFIQEHVPYTVSLETGKFDYEKVIANKNAWIMKPEDSYGSYGVHAGVECDDAQWKAYIDANMNTHYILQQFCMPYTTDNIDLMADEHADFKPYSNLTGLFVYNGQFKGCYSRISQSEIISTQYSEMALPTIVVED